MIALVLFRVSVCLSACLSLSVCLSVWFPLTNHVDAF